jgi:hypothetical protein
MAVTVPLNSPVPLHGAGLKSVGEFVVQAGEVVPFVPHGRATAALLSGPEWRHPRADQSVVPTLRLKPEL